MNNLATLIKNGQKAIDNVEFVKQCFINESSNFNCLKKKSFEKINQDFDEILNNLPPSFNKKFTVVIEGKKIDILFYNSVKKQFRYFYEIYDGIFISSDNFSIDYCYPLTSRYSSKADGKRALFFEQSSDILLENGLLVLFLNNYDKIMKQLNRNFIEHYNEKQEQVQNDITNIREEFITYGKFLKKY